MSDAARVVDEISLAPARRNTDVSVLEHCATRDYRDQVATKYFDQAASTGGLYLISYDVTTLHFGEVLHGIVDIAKTSPLADLGDLDQIRAALNAPDQVWDL